MPLPAKRLLLATSLALTVFPVGAMAQDRGRLLYQNHCVACHESTVHIRAGRKARSLADIEMYARRFAKLAGVEWDDADIMAVVDYLNRTHYKFEPR